jgi:hypothetical protein
MKGGENETLKKDHFDVSGPNAKDNNKHKFRACDK